VRGASRAAMREWCPHCGRKGLIRLGALGTKRRDHAGYTCGHCDLGFIISETDPEAFRAARAHLGHVTPDPDGPRPLPRFWP
jgi:hypothetical protein